MLLTIITASALFLSSMAHNKCASLVETNTVAQLIQKLEATNCFCLPISSENCTTPCFQEGLAQLTNITMGKDFNLNFQQVKKRVEFLQKNNCPVSAPLLPTLLFTNILTPCWFPVQWLPGLLGLFFSCDHRCSQTTTVNTLTFLKHLLETFQKQNMRNKV
ncbi:PREDICTED: interleukin-9 [Elephantulus edwardii]|uniref:interleukin-9 n=1 Tax=Elephantulus edwardii TaxID=28737 RepID=UPI0003F09ED6|nr:PREDICTED: interleukin-9 [Elephantulus edwardii]